MSGFSLKPAKVARVAAREFASTALTKGFIIGALVVPAILVAVIPLIGLLAASAKPKPDSGRLVVLDRTGEVAPLLAERLDPDAVRSRWEANAARVADKISDVGGALGGFAKQATQSAVDQIPFPEFTIERLPEGADMEAEKQRVRDQLGKDSADGTNRVLAVVEIDADAVRRSEGADGFGSWQMFTRPKLSDVTLGEIENSVEWSIREKRYEAAGVDRAEIDALTRIGERPTQEITATGERKGAAELTQFLPAVFMFLILMAVFTGGQYLLTTTIEEKSSRVVEVLLSAVSPMELMTGKVLGQMGVGLSLLIIYSGVGIAALIAFALADLISPMKIVYMLIFFVLAYAMFASLLGAIGSAVNDMREAQSLMTPVMLFAMIPYFLFIPVIRAPNSVLSTTLSFTPPIAPFVMMMRVASIDPPPAWQVLLGIAVSALGALLCLWFAAKVFRVGLLMYGKPPNLKTLLKWVRMA